MNAGIPQGRLTIPKRHSGNAAAAADPALQGFETAPLNHFQESVDSLSVEVSELRVVSPAEPREQELCAAAETAALTAAGPSTAASTGQSGAYNSRTAGLDHAVFEQEQSQSQPQQRHQQSNEMSAKVSSWYENLVFMHC
jgi:hypothetical protein